MGKTVSLVSARNYLLKVLQVLVFLALILNAYSLNSVVDVLHNNTREYESYSKLYVTPDSILPEENKVEVDKTFYTIKEVYYTYRSTGQKFDTSSGTLVLGYRLAMSYRYISIVISSSVALVMFTISMVRSSLGYWGSVRRLSIFSSLYVLSLLLLVYCIALVLLPLF